MYECAILAIVYGVRVLKYGGVVTLSCIDAWQVKTGEETIVWREYEDFEWLHHCLLTLNNGDGLLVRRLSCKIYTLMLVFLLTHLSSNSKCIQVIIRGSKCTSMSQVWKSKFLENWSNIISVDFTLLETKWIWNCSYATCRFLQCQWSHSQKGETW